MTNPNTSRWGQSETASKGEKVKPTLTSMRSLEDLVAEVRGKGAMVNTTFSVVGQSVAHYDLWSSLAMEAMGFEHVATLAPDREIQCVGVALAMFPCKLTQVDKGAGPVLEFAEAESSLYSASLGLGAKGPTRLPFGSGKVASVAADGLILSLPVNGVMKPAYSKTPYKKDAKYRIPATIILQKEYANDNPLGDQVREQILQQFAAEGLRPGKPLELWMVAFVEQIRTPKQETSEHGHKHYVALNASAFAIYARNIRQDLAREEEDGSAQPRKRKQADLKWSVAGLEQEGFQTAVNLLKPQGLAAMGLVQEALDKSPQSKQVQAHQEDDFVPDSEFVVEPEPEIAQEVPEVVLPKEAKVEQVTLPEEELSSLRETAARLAERVQDPLSKKALRKFAKGGSLVAKVRELLQQAAAEEPAPTVEPSDADTAPAEFNPSFDEGDDWISPEEGVAPASFDPNFGEGDDWISPEEGVAPASFDPNFGESEELATSGDDIAPAEFNPSFDEGDDWISPEEDIAPASFDPNFGVGEELPTFEEGDDWISPEEDIAPASFDPNFGEGEDWISPEEGVAPAGFDPNFGVGEELLTSEEDIAPAEFDPNFGVGEELLTSEEDIAVAGFDPNFDEGVAEPAPSGFRTELRTLPVKRKANVVKHTLEAAKPSSFYPDRSLFPALEDQESLASQDLVRSAWGGIEWAYSKVEDEAKPWEAAQPWVEVVAALLLWSGSFTMPLKRGEEYVTFGPIPNKELLRAVGVETQVMAPPTSPSDAVLKVWKEMPNKFRPFDVLRAINTAKAHPKIKVITPYPTQLLRQVMAAADKAGTAELPPNLIYLPPGWLRLDRAPLGSAQAFWALQKMNIEVRGDEDGFTFRLEGDEWTVTGLDVIHGGRYARPVLAVASVGAHSLVSAADMVVRTPVTSLVMAMLESAKFIAPDRGSVKGSARLWGAFEQAVVEKMSWDDEQEWSYVEEERAAFVRNSCKAKFISGELPLAISYSQGVLTMHKPGQQGDNEFETTACAIPDHYLDAPALEHNLVHVHKGTAKLFMPAALAMTKMAWIPAEAKRQYVLKAVSAASGVEATEESVAKFLRKNLGAEGTDEAVLSWFEQEGVILFSTKESKLTKRIVLGRPNAMRPLGVERKDRCVLAAERTIREEFMAGGRPEGLLVRVLRAPHLTLPAGVAIQTRRFFIEDEDTFKGEYAFDPALGFNLLIPAEEVTQAIVGKQRHLLDHEPFDYDYRWRSMPEVTPETIVLEIPFMTENGVATVPVRACSTGRLRSLRIRELQVAGTSVLKVTGCVVSPQTEIKGRSDGLKFMATSDIHADQILALNEPHPLYGPLDTDLILPGDADKSDAMSIWMASAAVQTGEQLGPDGKPLFPALYREIQALRAAAGCPTGGLTLPNSVIGGGGLRPLFEAFESTFGQFVWFSFIDSAVGPRGGNVVTLTSRLLKAKIGAGKVKGFISDSDNAPLPETILAKIREFAPVDAEIIGLHPFTRDGNEEWTNVYAFWTDEKGRARMVVRSWAYAGWEEAPLVEVIKAEGISVRKSVSSMRTMAGAIRGAALAGDVAYARALAEGHEKNLWSIIALQAMYKGADITVDGKPVEMVTLKQGTLAQPDALYALQDSRIDGDLVEHLAELYPRTAFRIGDITLWFPGVARLGSASSKDSFVGLVDELATRLIRGQDPDAPGNVLLVKRIKGRMDGLLKSANLRKSILSGRPSALCKTVSAFGVPDGVFLVRHVDRSEPCWETSMYRELSRYSRKVHGTKYMLWRPPLTTGCMLRAHVVYPTDELWPLVADRPHVTVIPIWAALADGGDNDGDGRPHTDASDSNRPITTCEDVLAAVEAFTGVELAEQETYLADQLLPKARASERSGFGSSKKSVKTLSWVRQTFSAATEFNSSFGASHEFFHFVECLVELLSGDPAAAANRPEWINNGIVGIASQIYETTLGGYDATMKQLIKEWLVPILYEGDTKVGKDKLESGRDGEAGLLRAIGLDPSAASLLQDLLLKARAAHEISGWVKASKPEAMSVPGRVLPEDPHLRASVERSIWIAALTHLISKGAYGYDHIEESEDATEVQNIHAAFGLFLSETKDREIIKAIRRDDTRGFTGPFSEKALTLLAEGNEAAPGSIGAAMLIKVARIIMRAFALNKGSYNIDSVVLPEPKPVVEYVATDFDPSMLDGLSPDQREAVEGILSVADPDLDLNGCAADGPPAGVLLLGGPGTGKSHTLRVALKAVRARYGDRVNVLVTGSTGTAAQNISTVEFPARTLNSAFGLGACGSILPAGLADKGVARGRKDTRSVASNKRVWKRLAGGEVLLVVVDEISMASSESLVLAAEIARLARRDRPSSVRFVLVGDFNQLPVVQSDDTPTNPAWRPAQFQPVGGRLVERPSLLDTIDLLLVYQLSTAHRQTDNAFLKWSQVVAEGNVCRMGTIEHAKAFFGKFLVSAERPAPADALHIFPDNRRVQAYNQAKVDAARAKGTKVYTFDAVINEGQMTAKQAEKSGASWVQDIAPIPLTLQIFEGCPVQFRVNENGLNPRYANGTTGIVRKVDRLRREVEVEVSGQRFTVGQVPIRIDEDESGRPPVSIRQFPFVVAYAMTGHKVQGQTINGPVVVHMGEDRQGRSYPVQTRGWAYVAMTRVKDPETQLFLDCNLGDFLTSVSYGDEERVEIGKVLARLMET